MSDVRCKGCPLEGQPKVFNAVKKADICIVGESPGKQEEEDGKPFVGPSGALLWKTLQEFGIYRIDVAILNACRCRIPQDFKKRFKNVETVVSYCKPFFEEDLAAVSPKLILCLGEISYYQLTGKRSFSRDRGKPLQHPTLDAVIVPLYHPAYILYSGGRSETNPQFLIWRNEIQNALSLIRRDIVVDNSIGDIVPLREGCIKGEAIAVDAEWNEEDELLIFSICDGDKVYYVLPEDLDRLRSYVNELFSTKVVIFANRPADERILLRYGIRFPKYAADIFNIARLLNDNLHKVSLDAIVKLVLADFSLKEEVKNKHVWELDRETLILYNAKDSFVTRKAFSRLYKELKQDYPLFKYWKYFILPVEEMLADVGCKGFPINKEKLEELRIQVDAEWTRMALDLMNRIPDKIKAVHTGKLSLTSNALIARYVFSPKKQGGLGFKPQKHTAAGAISVDEDHLSRFKHKSEWVRDFLNWKQLEKMRSTYINGLAKNTHPDGKIYPSIVLYATATGRTACYNPNIQQVPRKALPFVKEFKSLYSAPEGWVMCARDLSQSEIRIVAWLAQEKNMLKALYDGVDIHSHTASVLLGKPISEITKDERQAAKPANFGFIYGMQAYSFRDYAEKEYGIKMSLAEAERFRRKYFEAYPQLPAFHRRCIQIVEKYGYIRSVLGRVRRLPTAKSQDFKVRNEAYRQAINFCVQSFSSDLALLGMWLFWKEVKDKSDVQVLWFIHDAVFFICEESKTDHYMALLKECMEERAPQYVEDKFKVTVGYPVVSDGKLGKDWGHMEEYKEAS